MSKSAEAAQDLEVTTEFVNDALSGVVEKIEDPSQNETPHARVIRLAKAKEAITEQYKKASQDLEQALQDVGVDKFIQDPESLVVYQVVRPKGRYVVFAEIDYQRSRLPGEKSGDLSNSRAEEAGFVTWETLERRRLAETKEATKAAKSKK